MDLGILTIFTAGLLTFLSPCILPVLPVYIAMFVGSGMDELYTNKKKRFVLFFNSLFFLSGFIIVFVLMGMSATALGGTLLKHRSLFEQLGGLLIFTFGLKYMGVLHIELLNKEKRVHKIFNSKFKWLNSFFAGFFFAFGWTPCVGPILGTILTYSAISASNVFEGGFFLLVYSFGFALPLLVLPLFFEPMTALLNKAKKAIPIIEKITGVILLAMGILMVTGNMSVFTPSIHVSHTISNENSTKKSKSIKGTHNAEIICKVDKQGNSKCDSNNNNTIPDSAFEVKVQSITIDGIRNILKGEYKKPIFVEFYSSHCTICRGMIPTMSIIEKSCLKKNLTILKINISIPEYKKLAQEYGIIGVPTFIFLKDNGKEVARLIGHQELSALEKVLSTITSGECSDFSTF